MYSLGRNIAAEILSLYAAAATSATAGGSGDATEVTGVTIDTSTFPTRAESIAFVLAATATLTAAKTHTVTAKIEDSADASTWATLVASATVILQTATGTSTKSGRIGADLNTARRYVRLKYTPDLSHTATDTSVTQSIAVLGGLQEVPQP